jgi:2-methylaconitate cis-trans-isomerase PrpF
MSRIVRTSSHLSRTAERPIIGAIYGSALASTSSRRVSTYKKQDRLPAAYYRGGTSRAIIFHQKDLPLDREHWAPIFRGVINSPDPNGRQLDGLGGGISSLSKVCVVGNSTHAEADVDYTFAAVGVKDDEVDSRVIVGI